jgi:HrpA-like RNA helicase
VGKFGLGFIEHPEPDLQEKSYELKPTPEQLKKFEILEPAVQKLIKNLEDPQGTKVSILVGPTGTGKSVWAPTQILRSSIGRDGRICVTQPRLVTLRTPKGKSEEATTPGFVAKSLLGADAVGAGQEVGLLYSGEGTKSDRFTRLLYVTDGILIRWILTGQLSRFSVVMIDEAHEQSANMELIFALMRYHLPLYPRLRLVIMSATMDVERFSNFFGDGKPGSVFVAAPDKPATLCQIHDRWPDGEGGYGSQLPGFKLPTEAKDCPAATAAVVKAIRSKGGFTRLGNPKGDILCFVPTVRLVDETVKAVQALNLPGLSVHPCHAQMEEEDVVALQQSEVRARTAMEKKQNSPTQRVIVATNYAETSVTFANLRYVIDSGFIMEPVWDPETCSMDYPVRRHSQAGCTQRKGRVGRVQDGEIFRLYSKAEFEKDFPPNPRAAIAREPLEKFLLAAKAAGVANLDSFKWLGFDQSDELQRGERERSLSSLSRHGVVDKDGDITHRGMELEGVRHASLDWSRAMSESDGMACALEVATFLAFTELQRAPFVNGEEGLLAGARWSEGCADDLEFYLRLFHNWSKAGEGRTPEEHAAWSKREGLNHRAFREIEKSRAAALEEFAERTHTSLTERALDLARVERTRLVLTRALYPWVYVQSPDKDGSYVPLNPELCPCKAKVRVDQDSACDLAESLKAFLCVSRQKYRDEVYALHIIRVKPEWLEAGRAQSPVSIAVLGSRKSTTAGTSWETGADKRIDTQAEEPLRPSSFKVGALARFRVQRLKPGKERGKDPHIVLAVDEKSGRPVVLSFDGGIVTKGDTVRAHVVYTKGDLMLQVSQKQIVASYKVDHTFPKSALKLIKELREDDRPDGEVTGHLFEIEPGVTGMLRRHPDPKFHLWWAEYLAGRVQTLRVFKNDGRIALGLYFPDPQIGMVYRGVVEEVKYSDSTHKVLGLRVLFLPGRTGMVFWRTVARGTIERYVAGECVNVRVSNVQEKDGRKLYDLELIAPKLY